MCFCPKPGSKVCKTTLAVAGKSMFLDATVAELVPQCQVKDPALVTQIIPETDHFFTTSINFLQLPSIEKDVFNRNGDLSQIFAGVFETSKRCQNFMESWSNVWQRWCWCWWFWTLYDVPNSFCCRTIRKCLIIVLLPLNLPTIVSISLPLSLPNGKFMETIETYF